MKAIINDIIRTDSNKELIVFAESIDFTELFESIKSFTSTACVFNQPEIETNKNGGVFIRFTSEDIANKCGPFAAILKKCTIENFSNGVYRDKETDEIKYWVSVSIRYTHLDGGSNGMDICWGVYTEDDGWEIKNAGSRYQD